MQPVVIASRGDSLCLCHGPAFNAPSLMYPNHNSHKITNNECDYVIVVMGGHRVTRF